MTQDELNFYQEEEQISERIKAATTLNQMVDLYWELLEESDGEVTMLIEHLSNLIKNKKADTLAYIIDKNYEIDGLINGRKEHIKALQESNKKLEKQQETLKLWADSILKRDNLSSYKCRNGNYSYRKSTTVEVNLDELPASFMVSKTTTSPDKRAIKEALKTEEVKGAKLVVNNNLVIK